MTLPQMLLLLLPALLLTLIITSSVISRRMRKKVNYMLDALEDNELNFRFDEKPLFDRSFNKTLNRLRNIFDNKRKEILEQENYFGQMLDHVTTGIAVIQPSGRVAYSNNTALALLGMATFSHVRQLRTISESLYQTFLTINDQSLEERAEYYNESGKITLSLTASSATIGKETVRIIALNNISQEMAENEQESWSKLIRVLTHEIMNTVTPIASLSDTLLSGDASQEDINSGLDSISQSSKSLIKFVENYRKLTRIATPVKKAIYVSDLIERVLHLTREQMAVAGTTCTFVEKSEDILLYADEGQIAQIMINLIKNAVQADARHLTITASINLQEQVIIQIANDGHPISPESQEQIFIPFFTTKQDGTGIGLSLSRQIMRLHNGNLQLTRSDSQSTIFTLTFR